MTPLTEPSGIDLPASLAAPHTIDDSFVSCCSPASDERIPTVGAELEYSLHRAASLCGLALRCSRCRYVCQFHPRTRLPHPLSLLFAPLPPLLLAPQPPISSHDSPSQHSSPTNRSPPLGIQLRFQLRPKRPPPGRQLPPPPAPHQDPRSCLRPPGLLPAAPGPRVARPGQREL